MRVFGFILSDTLIRLKKSMNYGKFKTYGC